MPFGFLSERAFSFTGILNQDHQKGCHCHTHHVPQPLNFGPVNDEKITDWHAFDADTGKDSAREIREYYIPDFSNWKDRDSYAAAFQRLLRDLDSEGKDGR